MKLSDADLDAIDHRATKVRAFKFSAAKIGLRQITTLKDNPRQVCSLK